MNFQTRVPFPSLGDNRGLPGPSKVNFIVSNQAWYSKINNSLLVFSISIWHNSIFNDPWTKWIDHTSSWITFSLIIKHLLKIFESTWSKLTHSVRLSGQRIGCLGQIRWSQTEMPMFGSNLPIMGPKWPTWESKLSINSMWDSQFVCEENNLPLWHQSFATQLDQRSSDYRRTVRCYR